MSLTIDLQGLPETQRLLAEFSESKVNNRVKRALRAGLKPIREELRTRARSKGYPKTFRRTRTRDHRNPTGVSVSPGSPLSNIFEVGAKRHQIGGATKVLSNFEERRQAADRFQGAPFFARGAVSHPGMAARPISGPAFDARQGEAERAISAVLFEGL